jgi:hypothetical protein
LPAETNEASDFIAEKSFVNDVAEIDGVGVLDEVELLDALLDDELDDELELPHAATTMAAVTATTMRAALLLSTCIFIPLLLRRAASAVRACTVRVARFFGDHRQP